MDAVLADLCLRDGQEVENETSSIRRYEADLRVGLVIDCPVQSSRPKESKPKRIVRIEAETRELSRHVTTYPRRDGPRPRFSPASQSWSPAHNCGHRRSGASCV